VIEDEHIVISGTLQSPSRIADLGRLDSSYFTSVETKALFSLITSYKEKTGNIIDLALAKYRLERSEKPAAEKLLVVLDEYEDYAQVTDPEFKFSFSNIVDDKKKAMLREGGAAALEEAIDGDWREAQKKFRETVLSVEDAVSLDAPRNVTSIEEVLREKKEVEEPDLDLGTGFDTGFSMISNRLSVRRSELTVLAGYSGDGKSQLSKTMAYNANRAGANVLFVALEMEYREMLVLFLCQHAASINPSGLNYRDILDRTLSDRDKKTYFRAIDDFGLSKTDDTLEAETKGGKLFIWSPSKEIKMSHLTDRVSALKDEQGLDVVVVDYLELVRPNRDFGQYRLNVKDMVERCKWMAREEQAWVIANHQISRSGRDSAEKRDPKHYLLRDLGESSGVERSADHVFWIYNDADLMEDKEVKIGVSKARKGKVIPYGFHVYADFEKSLIAEIDD
jgi:replicative DNA helicase